MLYEYFQSMYEKHEDRTSFSVEEFCAYVRAHTTDLELLLDQLLAADIGEDILTDLVEEAKQRHEAMEIALLAVQVNEGKKKFDELLTRVKQLDTIETSPDEFSFVTDDLDVLYNENVLQQGLRWRLQTLNEMLGSLRKGDFGFIFARPETGKTTFLASEVSYFVQQIEKPILWFNNEEQGEKVKLRVYQAVLGYKLSEIHKDHLSCRQKYADLTGHRIKLYDDGNIHRRVVERICRVLQPGLIIFDQIDKIKGFDDDREDLRLGAIYQWARELAKEYCPIIGVSQADASGEGKKWLTMENVANAKTAKQAEADWILGIGKTNDIGLEYIRHLHLSKNKLTGDEDTIPEQRHGRRDVRIFPEIARYGDI